MVFRKADNNIRKHQNQLKGLKRSLLRSGARLAQKRPKTGGFYALLPKRGYKNQSDIILNIKIKYYILKGNIQLSYKKKRLHQISCDQNI